MQNYYLETNALRGLGSKITKLDPANRYSTSVLSIIELISASINSERSYSILKSCLSNLRLSKIIVDWAYPEKKLAQTFDALQYREERHEDLQAVLVEIYNAPSLASCKANLEAKGLVYGLDFIKHYDNLFGTQFIQASIQGCREIKAVFDKKQTTLGDTIFLESELKLTFLDFCKVFATKYETLNRSITIRAFAAQMATWLEDTPSEELVEKIYNSYNGKANYLIDALSYYSMIQVGKQNHPGRNDFLDLFHFAYVEPGAIIVTNDRDIIQICENLQFCATQKPTSLPLITGSTNMS